MTNYALIDTMDLMNRWNAYGQDFVGALVIYMDRPHQVVSISQDKRDVTVTTDLDTFVVPRGDKSTKMWRVLD